MRKLLKNRFLACVLVFGLTGSIAGATLAGECPTSVSFNLFGSTWTCRLIIEYIFPDGGNECVYECDVITS